MDFRIKLFEIIATQLGLNKTSYDMQAQTICYDEYLYVYFTNSQKVIINAICMPIPSEKVLVATTFCELMNPFYSHVNFTIQSEYLIAYGAILNSIFMEDEPELELKNHIQNLIEEIKSGVQRIFDVVNHTQGASNDEKYN